MSEAARPLRRDICPLDERKEGGRYDYICGVIPILYLCHCSRRSVLSDFSRQKKIAATICQ